MICSIPRNPSRIAAKRRGSHRAFSLVEMICAVTLTVGMLAPTLAVMRDAMATSREGTRRKLLANYAVEVLENQAALVMQNWTTGTVTGSFSGEGYSSIRYSVTKSDSPASGGLTNQLMHIQATVYYDDNGNSTLDANEIKVKFRTKVAKLASYQNEPN